MASNAEVARLFAHHPPKTDKRIEQHDAIREAAATLAVVFNEVLPDSREKSLALTNLQDAAMWANAAVALHE